MTSTFHVLLFSFALGSLANTAVVGTPNLQEQALIDFTLQEKLKATLWAGTDLVHSPVAIDVDAKGRVWVTEDLQKTDVKGSRHSRIKILSDTDGDGRADKVQLFGPTFDSKPMGISVFDNVVVVAMAPVIHVYTDVNRDDVFDPTVDKEEIIAKGFHGSNHDHALHAVVPGPSGKWYVNHGNIGADVIMSDGREIHSSAYYSRNPKSRGQESYDGRVYVGGFGLRFNPDGSDAEVIFQNCRNTHGMFVTSFGDVLHADNDDPTHARAAWAMEYGNFGYASLENGSRSWEDAAKSWEKKVVTQDIADSAYERHGKNVLRVDEGHWRQHYPGVTPPGNVWGPGAPTGDYFVEGDELGEGLRGRYLMCETVHKAVFSFRPVLRDAQVELIDLNKTFFATDRKSRNPFASGFLPSDIVAGTDGSLFVSDWNTHINGRGSGNPEGAIYRISRADEQNYAPQNIDFESTSGLLNALKSPAPGVRWVAQDKLKKTANIYDALARFHNDNTANPYHQARAVFILAQLEDDRARRFVEDLLDHEDPQVRIVAFRALRFGRPDHGFSYLPQLVKDTSPAVRREALHAMRNLPLEEISVFLAECIKGYDGRNRWYLEAIGSVCDGRNVEVYRNLVRPLQTNPAQWNQRQKLLAWRLRAPQAREDLVECMIAQNVAVDEFRQLCYTFALCYSEAERTENLAHLQSLGTAFVDEAYKLVLDEFLEKDVRDEGPIPITRSYVFPKAYGVKTELASEKEIVSLTPDLKNGENKAALCMMCHQLDALGVAFGPDLSNWGNVRDTAAIVHAIVAPAAELAHGYDKPVRITQNEHVLEGIMRNYSYHAGSVRVKTFGGQTLHLPFRKQPTRIEHLENHSWMPSAAEMGLSNQDVRDISAYLQGESGDKSVTTAEQIVPSFSRGTGPGWVALMGRDFLNVNCQSDTWRWEGGHAYCTGSPTGVIRYREPLTNFEFSCEWMHKKKGGNSGVFVWATPGSILNLTQGKGRLPHGIEVQVLDLGYREVYEAQYQKPSDWFTSHGDVFPVGPIKMNPFPPVAPNGKRSFPSQETTLGLNQWNHYYIRAIDGEVRLWVNGVEVSGGNNISPASGFLCLESEGAPVEYKNIRLRKLPPLETRLPEGMEIPVPVNKNPANRTPVTLKGHAILGTWAYLGSHTREFFTDGRCILRNGTEVVWTKRSIAKTPDSITLEGGYQHHLKGEILEIEGRYQAKRRK